MAALSNAHRGWSAALLVTLVPSVLLPLLVVGFSTEPALRWRRLESEAAELRERIAVSSVGADANAEEIAVRQAAALSLSESLRELVPASIDTVEVYGAARLAAESAGVELKSIQLGATRPLGINTLSNRELTLQGRSRSEHLAELVRALRALGFPCQVTSIGLSRTTTDSLEFDFNLGLGLYSQAHARPSGETSQ